MGRAAATVTAAGVLPASVRACAASSQTGSRPAACCSFLVSKASNLAWMVARSMVDGGGEVAREEGAK